MAEPFIGEMRMVGFNFPPRNWTKCDGALLPISQNQALYALLGVTFGGDGRTNFKLPDMRGRAPVHPGTLAGVTVLQGEAAGSEEVTLTTATMPAHTHSLEASSDPADQQEPTGNVLAQTVPVGTDTKEFYGAGQSLASMNVGSVASTGGGQGHANVQPTQVVNFCIALQGLFPSRN